MPVRPRLSHGHGSPERQAAMRPATGGPGEQSGCAVSSSLCKDTHTCVRAHTHTYTEDMRAHTCVHARAHTCTQPMHTHVHAQTHTCACTCTHVRTRCLGAVLGLLHGEAAGSSSPEQEAGHSPPWPRLGPALARGHLTAPVVTSQSSVWKCATARTLRLCVRRHSTHPGWEDRQSRT